MGVDVLATQGARASKTMMFTMLNRMNSAPARVGLIKYHMTFMRLKSFCCVFNLLCHTVSWSHQPYLVENFERGSWRVFHFWICSTRVVKWVMVKTSLAKKWIKGHLCARISIFFPWTWWSWKMDFNLVEGKCIVYFMKWCYYTAVCPNSWRIIL